MASSYAKNYAINAVVIFVGLLFYLLLFNFIIASADLTWLQRAEAVAVSSVQNYIGINSTYNSSDISITYGDPQFSVMIIALCTGVGEILFFAFLVLLIRGPKPRTKLKGLVIFLPLIFIINFIRLLAVQPLAAWLGVGAMWDVNWLIWKYGMFAVLMALFAAWVLVFARKDLDRHITDKK